jgi:hypothetical protein
MATQINAYHDDGCGEYAYTVFSQQFGCQDINGIEGVILVNSNAQCNIYGDNSCTDFQFELVNQENSCFNIGGGGFGSIACVS